MQHNECHNWFTAKLYDQLRKLQIVNSNQRCRMARRTEDEWTCHVYEGMT
jgi:hypothetical protein